jgi:hypothetical protein
MPLIGGAGVIMVALIVFVVLIMNNGSGATSDLATPQTQVTDQMVAVADETGTPEPTATPTPIPTVSPQEAILRLRYNADLIVLVNEGPSTLFMSGLNIRGTDDTDSYQSSSLGALQPGECLVVKNNVQSSAVPADWRCNTAQEVTVTSSNSRFWYADTEEDRAFRLYTEGQDAGTCDTIGRLVSRDTAECSIEWPAFDTERQNV